MEPVSIEEPAKKKRRSRFDDDGTGHTTQINPIQTPSISVAQAVPAPSLNDKIIQENALKALEIQAQLAAQIASVTNLLKTVQSNKEQQQQVKDKKSSYRPLLLDSQGREIDEFGQLVKYETQQKTLALNNAVIQAKRKKENPYLAHRTAPSSTIPSSTVPGFTPISSDLALQAVPQEVVDSSVITPLEVFDERVVVSNRDRRGKKSLHFTETGTS